MSAADGPCTSAASKFFQFVWLRHQLFLTRQVKGGGGCPPSHADLIARYSGLTPTIDNLVRTLPLHSYCNVYRELDAGSVYLQAELTGDAAAGLVEECLFKVIVYRRSNRQASFSLDRFRKLFGSDPGPTDPGPPPPSTENEGARGGGGGGGGGGTCFTAGIPGPTQRHCFLQWLGKLQSDSASKSNPRYAFFTGAHQVNGGLGKYIGLVTRDLNPANLASLAASVRSCRKVREVVLTLASLKTVGPFFCK